MMQQSIKWGKRIVTGFFILIFTLGFFSKSLISITLPNVQVSEIHDGVEVSYTSELEGEIVAKKNADICLRGNALIQEVMVQKGEYVRKGDVLFTIDTTLGLQSSADEETLRNQIQVEKARMATLTSQTTLEAQNALASAKSKLKEAQIKYDHQKQLYDSGAISAEELQSALSNLETLKSEVATVESSNKLALAQNKVALSEVQQRISQYENSLKVYETASERYYDINSSGEVFSKYTGYVTKLPEKGQQFQTGEIIASIGICNTFNDLAFQIRIPQKYFEEFVKGSSVVNISTQSGKNIGLVAFDFDSAVFDSGEMKVLASFNDEPNILVYPTMKVSSRTTGSDYIGGEYLAVPRTAVVSGNTSLDGTNAIIYIIREEEDALGKSNVAVAVPVNVLSIRDEYAVITELRNIPSNKIIINPSARIKDGSKVYVCP